jgi:hypothetical protein
MDWGTLLNVLLGGGCLTGIIGVLTLRSTVTKAKAEADEARAGAEKARAEAERVRIDNVNEATKILMDNIVSPLRDELNATRKELASLKRAVAKLQKAVDAANSCPHSDGCVVLERMRECSRETGCTAVDGGGTADGTRQHGAAHDGAHGAEGDTGGHGGPADCRGQP